MQRIYRNPVIYARELRTEMLRDHLSRRQLALRHGVSCDRITQWLSLLRLPEETLREVEALGDRWARQRVTERTLRSRLHIANVAEGDTALLGP